MNTSKLLSMICFGCLLTTATYAQDNGAADCLARAERYMKYMPILHTMEKQNIAYFQDQIKECNPNGSPKIAYIQGRLKLASSNFVTAKEGAKLLEQASYSGLEEAAIDFGVLSITDSDGFRGKSYKSRFNEAFIHLQRYYKDPVAAYGLGYMWMKGLGIRQNYAVAKSHFERSTLPMAKHWLAVMHYHGYGVPKDKTKAKNMLKGIDTQNSKALLSYLNKYNPDTVDNQGHFKTLIDKFATQPFDDNTVTDMSKYGTMSGSILIHDFSGKKIVERLPISMDMNLIGGTIGIRSWNVTNLKINNKKFPNTEASIYDSSFTIGNLRFAVKEPYVYKASQVTRTIDFKGFKIKKIGIPNPGDASKTLYFYVATTTEAINQGLNEFAEPITLILHGTNPTSNNLQHSLEMQAVSKSKSPLRVFPNPFANQFTISYELDAPSSVSVEVFDTQNGQIVHKENTAR